MAGSVARLLVVGFKDAPVTGNYAFHQGKVIEKGKLGTDGSAPFGKIDPKRPFMFEVRGRVNREKLVEIDLHWHDLRHEAACRWLAKGLDLRAIQLLLGHADLETTRRYLNVTDEELRKTMRESSGSTALRSEWTGLPPKTHPATAIGRTDRTSSARSGSTASSGTVTTPIGGGAFSVPRRSCVAPIVVHRA